ncbi:YciI family protein [Pelagibacterium luteolum]|uniref:YCII-related domain-containing protein n=1 Tax=Pelagibacterium luteolum TaxID=440168 RepID=A0A1G7SE69_9HYPH|nr:YciI family protein [Pelagibacterium luteolum]SDG20709.1 hypothetical protein SAMN04487974_101429 [Pelagibacterium luteolum]
MMFAVVAFDKAGNLDKRLETRPAHLQYWEDNADAMVLAGPFLDDDGKAVGSMMVVEAKDRHAATAIVSQDPYAVAGVFETVEIRPWNWVIKRPEGL